MAQLESCKYGLAQHWLLPAINVFWNCSRTMIAEITVERKYQSRAFLILPISFSVASTLGPRKYRLPNDGLSTRDKLIIL